MADHNKYRQFEYWSLNCQGVTFRPCHIILTPAVEEGCNKSKSEIYSAWSISSIDRVEPKIVPFSWGRYHRHFPMDKCGRWWCSGRTWPWFPHRFLSNIFAKWDLSHALFWNEFAIRLWFHCLVQKKYSCCPVHNWKKIVFFTVRIRVCFCCTICHGHCNLRWFAWEWPDGRVFHFFSLLRAHVEWSTLGTPTSTNGGTSIVLYHGFVLGRRARLMLTSWRRKSQLKMECNWC